MMTYKWKCYRTDLGSILNSNSSVRSCSITRSALRSTTKFSRFITLFSIIWTMFSTTLSALQVDPFHMKAFLILRYKTYFSCKVLKFYLLGEMTLILVRTSPALGRSCSSSCQHHVINALTSSMIFPGAYFSSSVCPMGRLLTMSYSFGLKGTLRFASITRFRISGSKFWKRFTSLLG